MATSKRNSPAKKNAGKAPTKAGGPDLETRVKALEKRSGLSHELQDVIDRVQSKGTPQTAALRAQTNFKFLQDDVIAPATVVDVTIELDSKATTAKFTRVYLTGSTGDIASTAKPKGVLPRQVVGSTITVVMDVTGNPNDIGQFNVKNAQHSPISLKVSDGPTSIKSLHVTG